MSKIPALAFLAAVALAAPAIAQDKPATNMEIVRDKVRADKKLLVANNMALTESEAKGFWPVYDAYQKDLEQINQRLGKVIKDYADAYNKGPVSDAVSGKLLAEALAIEEAEVKLKQSYVPKLQKVIPTAKAARYMQIENKIRALVRYELAAEIPLVY